MREVMNRLISTSRDYIYGIVRDDENVIAFGRMVNGQKVRHGSISDSGVVGYEFLVLRMDNSEEYRARDLEDLLCFMNNLDLCGNTAYGWNEATMRSIATRERNATILA